MTPLNLPGDLRMLSAARYTARSNFNTNRSLSAGSPEAEAARTHAEEVALILRKNIVQGEQAEGEGEKYRECFQWLKLEDIMLKWCG